MALADQQATDCHDQRSKDESGGGVDSTAAKLKAFKGMEMGDRMEFIANDASVPTIGEEQEESPLFMEWKQRERDYLEYLEKVTSNPKLEQERLLEHILKKNGNSLYLQQFGLNGATDVKTFRERVPVSEYDDIYPFVQRAVQGDKSQLLCGDPVVEILASSGTSGGQSKLFPITEEDMSMRGLIWSLMRPVLNKQIPGLEKGRCMFIYTVLPGFKTKGGLVQQAAVTSFVMSKEFRQRPFDPSYELTSPDEVILAKGYDESTYCQLLCGLLHRTEVLRLGGIFSSGLVRYIHNLKEWWTEICEDLANGTLSEMRVQDESIRGAMRSELRADPELAELVRHECSKKSWEGIILRLWPNCRVLDAVCTGAMESYTPILNHYSGNLPIICTQLYAASEGFFGINLNPLCRPEEIYYTLLPSIAYYEFIPVSVDSQEDNDQVLDLSSVKEGREYEILATTVSGLCRYKIGDILKVVGFHNATPTFQFMRRKNTVLCVDTEKTDEKELHVAVTKAAKLLEEKLGLRLEDYTSAVDMSTSPPHYVIFMELREEEPIGGKIPTDLLEECCSTVEMTFNSIYRRNRFHKRISPLELRIVKEGSFERLAELAFSRGASPAQYKTPRGLLPKFSAQLEILTGGLIQQHTCQSCPPLSIPHAAATASNDVTHK